MATKKAPQPAQPRIAQLAYAVVGAGDLALEKARSVRNVVDPDMYGDLVARGRDLTGCIRKAAPTRQAVARTRTARSQAKAAATSVRKALRANATAARSAAEKVARAS